MERFPHIPAGIVADRVVELAKLLLIFIYHLIATSTATTAALSRGSIRWSGNSIILDTYLYTNGETLSKNKNHCGRGGVL